MQAFFAAARPPPEMVRGPSRLIGPRMQVWVSARATAARPSEGLVLVDPLLGGGLGRHVWFVIMSATRFWSAFVHFQFLMSVAASPPVLLNSVRMNFRSGVSG